MNSAASSNLSQEDRDIAIRFLTERAVFTRAVCQELRDSEEEFEGRRPCIALSLLFQWITAYQNSSSRFEPYCTDGIDAMIVPHGCESLLEEILDGSRVGQTFSVLLTADTPTQRKGDKRALQHQLQQYFSTHSSPSQAPSIFE